MPPRERLLMDAQWRFLLGDPALPGDDGNWWSGAGWAKAGGFTAGPASPDFDDSLWRVVDLPHDFVVERDLTPQSPAGRGTMHMLHGFRPGGVGWYRRTFEVPAGDLGRAISLGFDGAFRDSAAWLNGHFLGRHLSGYTPFRFDVSDILNYGGANTLAVRVDATQYEGWFYEGGGLYRHVWLVKTGRLRVPPHGVFVACAVDLGGGGPRATVTIRTEVVNGQDTARECVVVSTVTDPAGRAVARAETALTVPQGVPGAPGAAGAPGAEAVQEVEIPAPALWSVETPHLYTLTTTLRQGAEVVDECRTAFGVRHARFDADRGFFLNGKPLKLKGVCCHQDHAGLGSALPDAVHAYRIARLKDMGCNAYRCAHNPPAPELLDACDRLGMLVLDENRVMGSSAEVLGQLAELVRRDRNHPSVILWSIGNEEAIQGGDAAARIAATMRGVIRGLDLTRPVTLAMNGAWGRPVCRVLDVQGCNYIKAGDVDVFHREFPDKPVVFTESASALTTRGVYVRDAAQCHLTAYDVESPVWGNLAEENWRHCDAREFLAGTFVWTGFDYRGEPTPFTSWPCISSHFGIMDTCGFPKDSFYYYRAWWGDGTVLHLFPHWTFAGREGEAIDVWAHTNCEEVELRLNGRSLGRRGVPRGGHAEWKVPYEPGTLRADGFRAGRRVAEAEVQTAGPPAAIRLTPDRPALRGDGEDAALVRVEVVDAQGRPAPAADNQVTFEVAGPGRVIGVGNGNPSSLEADKATFRRAFGGLCQVVVQATAGAGAIRLTARSPGLREAAVEIAAEACTPRPRVEPSGPAAWSFECSDLQPAPAPPEGIGAAPPPGAGLAFRPAADVLGEMRDIRKFHGGADGLLYVRGRVVIGRAFAGSLAYGADGPVKVWVNGVEVACQPTATNPAKKDEYRARVSWLAGPNEVVFALATNGGKAWGIFARVAG